jgi:hypothetical protein
MFRSWRLGIPSPPYSVFTQIEGQLAKCIFLFPSASFHIQLADRIKNPFGEFKKREHINGGAR